MDFSVECETPLIGVTSWWCAFVGGVVHLLDNVDKHHECIAVFAASLNTVDQS
jgi:hypothetical protein